MTTSLFLVSLTSALITLISDETSTLHHVLQIAVIPLLMLYFLGTYSYFSLVTIWKKKTNTNQHRFRSRTRTSILRHLCWNLWCKDSRSCDGCRELLLMDVQFNHGHEFSFHVWKCSGSRYVCDMRCDECFLLRVCVLTRKGDKRFGLYLESSLGLMYIFWCRSITKITRLKFLTKLTPN